MISSFALIWDPLFYHDFNLVRSALYQSRPVIFSFIVPDSFDTSKHNSTDGKGFVVYSESEAQPADPGGHVVEIVGYMDNQDIPASLAITQGSGGGYFIVKNSWGKCFGDMGYAYLPYDWVNKWGTSMVVVNSVIHI